MIRTLFLDFDGVLHPRGGFPLSQAERLAAAIAQYPDVRIVLSTSWVETYGVEPVIEMLPDGLRERVIGATYAGGEAQPESRFAEIEACAARLGIDEWLAIDDDQEGWPEAKRHRLIWCDPSQGFDERATQALHGAFASLGSIPCKRIR